MPFGATWVSADGTRTLVSRNNQVTAVDPTGHAEMVLVREVGEAHGTAALRGATVFASGEPCAMCSGALFWTGVRRIVFAATAAEICASLGAPELPVTASEVLARADPKVSVEGPCLGDEAVAVLRAWRAARQVA